MLPTMRCVMNSFVTQMTAFEKKGFVVNLQIGDLFSAVSKSLGVTPCAACHAHAIAMNGFLPLLFRWPWEPLKNCRTFARACTGFGARQCVTVQESFTPDAAVIEQCCRGRFQCPWIEVCQGKPPEWRFGFCL